MRLFGSRGRHHLALALVGACGSLGAFGLSCHRTPPPSTQTRPAARADAAPAGAAPPSASMGVRTGPRLAPHAYGRTGDLVLRAHHAFYTFSSARDARGHKPLQGALLDADLDESDSEDPLLSLRVAWRGADGALHPLVAPPLSAVCALPGEPTAARPGVSITGEVAGVKLAFSACPADDGHLHLRLRAEGLPPGAKLAQELGPGPSRVVLDHGGAAWEGTRAFAALAVEGPRSTLVLEGRGEATRTFVHIAKEVFPTPVALTYEGAEARVDLRVVPQGPALALGALTLPTSVLALGVVGGAGTAVFLDDRGETIATLDVPEGGTQARVPAAFAAEIELRDRKGQPCLRARAGHPDLAQARCARGARLTLAVRGEGHAPTPFHALVYGEGGTKDPELVDLVPRGDRLRSVSAHNNVYALDGRAELALPAGRYHVVVTRGLESTLEERHLELADGAAETLELELQRVLPREALSADFHLHAAPSPDSTVTLEERVATLACEGLGFAVATDHNRITDYSAAADTLTPAARPSLPKFAIGNEITSGGQRLWGHFNAYPLPAPGAVAPEDAAIAYFDILPRELFSGARAAGAGVVQVNHPRMPPKIGYFNQAELDPDTGSAAPEFAEDFDAVEAHNGIWLESPERVREALRDLVGLARRGKKVAATGNSDSHKLVLEEPGYPRTFVLLDPSTSAAPLEARVVDAVKRRHTVVSSGAFIDARLDGSLPGDVVRPRAARPGAARTMRLHVRVLAPAWVPVESVEIWVDDVIVKTFAVTGGARAGDNVRFEKDLDLPVDRDRTVTVWVDAKRPLPRVVHETDARAIAFTSPFYVDADGDGQVRVAPRGAATTPADRARAPGK